MSREFRSSTLVAEFGSLSMAPSAHSCFEDDLEEETTVCLSSGFLVSLFLCFSFAKHQSNLRNELCRMDKISSMAQVVIILSKSICYL